MNCALMSNSNIQMLVSLVNREFFKVALWYKVNKLYLNVAKTNYVIFRSKNRKVPNNLSTVDIDNLVITNLKTGKISWC